MPFQSIEMVANGLKIVRPQSHGQGGRVPASENPLQVRIGRWIERSQRVPSPSQNTLRDAPFDVDEETRIASQSAHHEAREKEAEHHSPTPGIPDVIVILFPMCW